MFGESPGVLGTDLGEVQVAQEEMRVQNEELEKTRAVAEAERQRYRDLFEFAPNGYVVTDAEGSIVEANRAAARLFGAPAGRLAGKPLIVFITSADRPCCFNSMSRLRL